MYVLTSAYNQYDQYGEYFIAAFVEKPTPQYLGALMGWTEDYSEYVLKGGGRKNVEDEWYIFTKYSPGTVYQET